MATAPTVPTITSVTDAAAPDDNDPMEMLNRVLSLIDTLPATMNTAFTGVTQALTTIQQRFSRSGFNFETSGTAINNALQGLDSSLRTALDTRVRAVSSQFIDTRFQSSGINVGAYQRSAAPQSTFFDYTRTLQQVLSPHVVQTAAAPPRAYAGPVSSFGDFSRSEFIKGLNDSMRIGLEALPRGRGAAQAALAQAEPSRQQHGVEFQLMRGIFGQGGLNESQIRNLKGSLYQTQEFVRERAGTAGDYQQTVSTRVALQNLLESGRIHPAGQAAVNQLMVGSQVRESRDAGLMSNRAIQSLEAFRQNISTTGTASQVTNLGGFISSTSNLSRTMEQLTSASHMQRASFEDFRHQSRQFSHTSLMEMSRSGVMSALPKGAQDVVQDYSTTHGRMTTAHLRVRDQEDLVANLREKAEAAAPGRDRTRINAQLRRAETRLGVLNEQYSPLAGAVEGMQDTALSGLAANPEIQARMRAGTIPRNIQQMLQAGAQAARALPILEAGEAPRPTSAVFAPISAATGYAGAESAKGLAGAIDIFRREALTGGTAAGRGELRESARIYPLNQREFNTASALSGMSTEQLGRVSTASRMEFGRLQTLGAPADEYLGYMGTRASVQNAIRRNTGAMRNVSDEEKQSVLGNLDRAAYASFFQTAQQGMTASQAYQRNYQARIEQGLTGGLSATDQNRYMGEIGKAGAFLSKAQTIAAGDVPRQDLLSSLRTTQTQTAGALLSDMYSDRGQITNRRVLNQVNAYESSTRNLGVLNERIAGMQQAPTFDPTSTSYTAAVAARDTVARQQQGIIQSFIQKPPSALQVGRFGAEATDRLGAIRESSDIIRNLEAGPKVTPPPTQKVFTPVSASSTFAESDFTRGVVGASRIMMDQNLTPAQRTAERGLYRGNQQEFAMVEQLQATTSPQGVQRFVNALDRTFSFLQSQGNLVDNFLGNVSAKANVVREMASGRGALGAATPEQKRLITSSFDQAIAQDFNVMARGTRGALSEYATLYETTQAKGARGGYGWGLSAAGGLPGVGTAAVGGAGPGAVFGGMPGGLAFGNYIKKTEEAIENANQRIQAPRIRGEAVERLGETQKALAGSFLSEIQQRDPGLLPSGSALQPRVQRYERSLQAAEAEKRIQAELEAQARTEAIASASAGGRRLTRRERTQVEAEAEQTVRGSQPYIESRGRQALAATESSQAIRELMSSLTKEDRAAINRDPGLRERFRGLEDITRRAEVVSDPTRMGTGERFRAGVMQPAAQLGQDFLAQNAGLARMALMFGLSGPMFQAMTAVPQEAAAQSVEPILTGMANLTGAAQLKQTIMSIPQQVPETMGMMQSQMDTLQSVLGSRAAAGSTIQSALDISRTQPVQFPQAMEILTSMAVQPATRGAVSNPKFQEDVFNAVQLLAQVRPEQGMEGALFAIRELMSGNARSMQMRFNMSPEVISSYADMSYGQFKSLPGQQMVGAMSKGLMAMFGGDEVLLRQGSQYQTQLRNVSDTFTQAVIKPLVTNVDLGFAGIAEDFAGTTAGGKRARPEDSMLRSILPERAFGQMMEISMQRSAQAFGLDYKRGTSQDEYAKRAGPQAEAFRANVAEQFRAQSVEMYGKGTGQLGLMATSLNTVLGPLLGSLNLSGAISGQIGRFTKSFAEGYRDYTTKQERLDATPGLTGNERQSQQTEIARSFIDGLLDNFRDAVGNATGVFTSGRAKPIIASISSFLKDTALDTFQPVALAMAGGVVSTALRMPGRVIGPAITEGIGAMLPGGEPGRKGSAFDFAEQAAGLGTWAGIQQLGRQGQMMSGLGKVVGFSLLAQQMHKMSELGRHPEDASGGTIATELLKTAAVTAPFVAAPLMGMASRAFPAQLGALSSGFGALMQARPMDWLMRGLPAPTPPGFVGPPTPGAAAAAAPGLASASRWIRGGLGVAGVGLGLYGAYQGAQDVIQGDREKDTARMVTGGLKTLGSLMMTGSAMAAMGSGGVLSLPALGAGLLGGAMYGIGSYFSPPEKKDQGKPPDDIKKYTVEYETAQAKRVARSEWETAVREGKGAEIYSKEELEAKAAPVIAERAYVPEQTESMVNVVEGVAKKAGTDRISKASRDALLTDVQAVFGTAFTKVTQAPDEYFEKDRLTGKRTSKIREDFFEETFLPARRMMSGKGLSDEEIAGVRKEFRSKLQRAPEEYEVRSKAAVESYREFAPAVAEKVRDQQRYAGYDQVIQVSDEILKAGPGAHFREQYGKLNEQTTGVIQQGLARQQESMTSGFLPALLDPRKSMEGALTNARLITSIMQKSPEKGYEIAKDAKMNEQFLLGVMQMPAAERTKAMAAYEKAAEVTAEKDREKLRETLVKADTGLAVAGEQGPRVETEAKKREREGAEAAAKRAEERTQEEEKEGGTGPKAKLDQRVGDVDTSLGRLNQVIRDHASGIESILGTRKFKPGEEVEAEEKAIKSLSEAKFRTSDEDTQLEVLESNKADKIRKKKETERTQEETDWLKGYEERTTPEARRAQEISDAARYESMKGKTDYVQPTLVMGEEMSVKDFDPNELSEADTNWRSKENAKRKAAAARREAELPLFQNPDKLLGEIENLREKKGPKGTGEILKTLDVAESDVLALEESGALTPKQVSASKGIIDEQRQKVKSAALGRGAALGKGTAPGDPEYVAATMGPKEGANVAYEFLEGLQKQKEAGKVPTTEDIAAGAKLGESYQVAAAGGLNAVPKKEFKVSELTAKDYQGAGLTKLLEQVTEENAYDIQKQMSGFSSADLAIPAANQARTAILEQVENLRAQREKETPPAPVAAAPAAPVAPAPAAAPKESADDYLARANAEEKAERERRYEERKAREAAAKAAEAANPPPPEIPEEAAPAATGPPAKTEEPAGGVLSPFWKVLKENKQGGPGGEEGAADKARKILQTSSIQGFQGTGPLRALMQYQEDAEKYGIPTGTPYQVASAGPLNVGPPPPKAALEAGVEAVPDSREIAKALEEPLPKGMKRILPTEAYKNPERLAKELEALDKLPAGQAFSVLSSFERNVENYQKGGRLKDDEASAALGAIGGKREQLLAKEPTKPADPEELHKEVVAEAQKKSEEETTKTRTTAIGMEDKLTAARKSLGVRYDVPDDVTKVSRGAIIMPGMEGVGMSPGIYAQKYGATSTTKKEGPEISDTAKDEAAKDPRLAAIMKGFAPKTPGAVNAREALVRQIQGEYAADEAENKKYDAMTPEEQQAYEAQRSEQVKASNIEIQAPQKGAFKYEWTNKLTAGLKKGDYTTTEDTLKGKGGLTKEDKAFLFKEGKDPYADYGEGEVYDKDMVYDKEGGIVTRDYLYKEGLDRETAGLYGQLSESGKKKFREAYKARPKGGGETAEQAFESKQTAYEAQVGERVKTITPATEAATVAPDDATLVTKGSGGKSWGIPTGKFQQIMGGIKKQGIDSSLDAGAGGGDPGEIDFSLDAGAGGGDPGIFNVNKELNRVPDVDVMQSYAKGSASMGTAPAGATPVSENQSITVASLTINAASAVTNTGTVNIGSA
jgi:hypothetical protein